MASDVNDKASSSIYCKVCGAANAVQATHCFACSEPLSSAPATSRGRTNPLTGLLLPEVIIQNRYRILEVISEENVNTVYKAEDRQLGNRMVMLKEIGRNTLSTQDALEEIEASKREMLLLAELVHPNLPRVYDYFVEDQRWYFVMDALEGETLEDYLRRRKYRPLPAEDLVDAGIQLSTALDYLRMHQPPLDSHDLTLSDIWRTPDGKLYLLDVGTTVAAVSEPERNSVYSLGVVLRQLQTGKTPTRPRLRFALPGLYGRIRYGKHPLSLPLKALIGRLVQKSIRKRPFSIGMVRQELQQLAMQQLATSSAKKRRFPRRAIVKLVGLGTVAAFSSVVTRVVEGVLRPQKPFASYSPGLGGTIHTYDAHTGVLAVAWSPNGTRLAMGNWAGKVEAWDASTGGHVFNFYVTGPNNLVEALVWLPNNSAIVAGGDNNLVWTWSVATGKLWNVYGGHADKVVTVACSPDSAYIASGGFDQTVQVWEVATSRQLIIYRGHSDHVTSVAWSPDGRYIASASYDMSVQVWEVDTGHLIYTYYGHTDAVFAVAWSPDGQRIASGGRDRTVQIWPVTLFNSPPPKNRAYYIAGRDGKSIQAVAWSPDSKYVASAGMDVQIWDGVTGKHIYTYTKHETQNNGAVQCVAWSPNGRYIASGGLEGTVQVWNAR